MEEESQIFKKIFTMKFKNPILKTKGHTSLLQFAILYKSGLVEVWDWSQTEILLSAQLPPEPALPSTSSTQLLFVDYHSYLWNTKSSDLVSHIHSGVREAPKPTLLATMGKSLYRISFTNGIPNFVYELDEFSITALALVSRDIVGISFLNQLLGLKMVLFI